MWEPLHCGGNCKALTIWRGCDIRWRIWLYLYKPWRRRTVTSGRGEFQWAWRRGKGFQMYMVGALRAFVKGQFHGGKWRAWCALSEERNWWRDMVDHYVFEKKVARRKEIDNKRDCMYLYVCVYVCEEGTCREVQGCRGQYRKISKRRNLDCVIDMIGIVKHSDCCEHCYKGDKSMPRMRSKEPGNTV